MFGYTANYFSFCKGNCREIKGSGSSFLQCNVSMVSDYLESSDISASGGWADDSHLRIQKSRQEMDKQAYPSGKPLIVKARKPRLIKLLL